MQTTNEQTNRKPEQLCAYDWIIEIKFALNHKFALLLTMVNNVLLLCITYICNQVVI